MVVIALCAALMGGYWWIRSHQATARLVPPAPAFMVEVARAVEGVGFVMSEEHPQFDELLGAFTARLPGFDTGWFLKVAFPAFETCETVIYQSASQ